MGHILSLFEQQQYIICMYVDLKLDFAAFNHNVKENCHLHNSYLIAFFLLSSSLDLDETLSIFQVSAPVPIRGRDHI